MSNRPTKTTRHAVAALLVGFAATLLIGDRLLTLVSPPEVYGSTNRSLWKWRLYETTSQRPDVVFLGCSYEVHAINPAVVDAELSQVHGRTLRSINLAASASSLLTEYLMVRRLLDRGARPSIVYLGVTPNAADTWLHPWLINGLKALGDWRDLALAAKGGSYLLAQAVPRSLFQSYHQWDDWRIIAERIILGAAIHPKTALTRYDTGWAEWRGRRIQSTSENQSDASPPSDPARLAPDNINGIALRRAIELLRAHGVAVRLVELPLSTHAAAFADPSRNPDYQRFIQTLVQQTGVTLIRPPEGIVTDADYWDDVHVTAQGAARISRWLAADVAQALADDSTDHLARNDS